MTAPDAPAAGGTGEAVTEARDAARAWLHAYGIRTERYTTGGGDHPMMDSLPAAFEAYAAAARAPSPAEVGRAGLEPPGCPIPGACACPGGESRLAERLAAELRRREAAEAEVRALRDKSAEDERALFSLRDLCGDYEIRLAAAEADAARARDVLRRVEWGQFDCLCRLCGRHEVAGHAPGCSLAAALVDHAPTSAGSASADDGMQSAATLISTGDGHGRG